MFLLEVPTWVEIVARLWPVVLILTILVIILVFRNSFKPLLSRVTALKIAGQEIIISENKSEIVSVKQEISTSSEMVPKVDEDKPDPSSKKTFNEVADLLGKQQHTDADLIFEQIQSQEHSSLEREKNKLFYTYLKFAAGFEDAIENLLSLIEATDTAELKSIGYYYLASCYKESVDYHRAIVNLEKAITYKSTERHYVSCITRLAECKYKIGRKLESYQLLIDSLSDLKEADSFHSIYTAIGRYYEEEKDSLRRGFALQKALAYSSNNSATLFNVAYTFSETKLNRLTLLHYHNLISFNPHSGSGYNNYGVVLGKHDLLGLSVAAYQKSVEQGSTTAASNLAEKYINIGFWDDAKKLLNYAKSQSEIDSNVWASLKRLNEKEKEENDFFDQYLRDGQKMKVFIDEYTDLFFLKEKLVDASITGAWVIEDHAFETYSINELGNWIFKIKEGEELRVVINNTRIGEAFYKRKDKKYTTVMENFEGLFYINESFNRIEIVLYPESNADKDILFFRLKKI